MRELYDLGPGFPQWTELGQDTGLDPLGMQRPIEVVYQSLLPGISTITLRLRYYSFFCWLLETYAKRRELTTDYEAFRRFHRRAEALYALISAKSGAETGVTGIEWANRQLALVGNQRGDAVVPFDVGADPDAAENLRYLRNRGGAFGGIYASQMQDMGLLKLDDPEMPIPFCKQAALPLATAFQDTVGEKAKLFLSVVDQGSVTLGELDQLAVFLPSKILDGSAEQQHLASILFGRHHSATDMDQTRRQSLQMILQLAEQLKRPPKAEEAKWVWLGAASSKDVTLPDTDLRKVWALYQVGDLLRMAYEVLLSASLHALNEQAAQRLPLPVVVARVLTLADPPTTIPLGDWMQSELSGQNLEDGTKAAKQAMFAALAVGDMEAATKAASTLILSVIAIARTFDEPVVRWLGPGGHFQSVRSESEFLRDREERPAALAFAELVEWRVLKRHLWVCSRKFRNQKAYTYLFEPDDGALRFRSFFYVGPSSPRIDQAVQFLRDLKCLDDGGVTKLGLQEAHQ